LAYYWLLVIGWLGQYLHGYWVIAITHAGSLGHWSYWSLAAIGWLVIGGHWHWVIVIVIGWLAGWLAQYGRSLVIGHCWVGLGHWSLPLAGVIGQGQGWLTHSHTIG